MTSPSPEWLEEHPAACRDVTHSLKPLPIRMVKKQGVKKLDYLTREEHFCPNCPRVPYGSREHGCIFAPPAEDESSAFGLNMRKWWLDIGLTTILLFVLL